MSLGRRRLSHSVKAGGTSRQAVSIRSIPCGTGSTRISAVTVSYSGAFKRQLKRLGRRYRRVRAGIQLIVDLSPKRTAEVSR